MVEAKFYEEVHQLECKYHELFTPLYEKRAQITKGMYEPTEAECDWPSEDEDLAAGVKDKVKLDGEKKDEDKKEDNESPAKGIPEFWLTIFKNVDMLQEMVQEQDEPVIAALSDVKVTFSEGSNE